jgi:hypothetical protein
VTPRRLFWGATLLVALIGLVLRLKGIHDPIFDHPGWRQGDTAAIARNFAQLQYNPLDPQTDYDGPPPNYVELELQIVPFLAATVYKLIGVHEIVGRLISLAFGVGTIVLIAPFGRWLFRSPLAGVAAAAVYAVLPGAWYYSRTFMPDTAMVFFLTAALYAGGRWIVDDEARSWRGCSRWLSSPSPSRCSARSRWRPRPSLGSGGATRSRARSSGRSRWRASFRSGSTSTPSRPTPSGTGPAGSRGCTCCPRCTRQ